MSELTGYNNGYLDEQTKRTIRRAILKAVAIPGYQVPFAGREMPMPYGWGTGGIEITASIIGDSDVLKVIDQGADDTTNAVSIRRFFQRVSGAATTEATKDATLIQTRHRIPETPLEEDQVLIFQVPIPELQLFGAGREKRIYALPPYTKVESLDFDDHPFSVQSWEHPCALCGSRHSYLDEVVMDDAGTRMFVCSDTDFCHQQQEQQHAQ
ncbi:hypothetical protein E05_42960 [Plautia stali symbiont]|nr:hypothetical protein E05_42960 [Plautia stali symbiont]